MNQIKKKRVSVCMAVHNGASYLNAQIDSVLQQLQVDDELIISDDASQDTSFSIIQGYLNDARVRYIRNEKRMGLITNFQHALRTADGQYVFLCDQDDVWLPGKVEACVDKLQKNLLVVTDCKVVDESLHVVSPSFFNNRLSGKGVLKNVWKNTYLGCCMAFNRELLGIGLPMPSNIPMHDMWLGILADIHGQVAFISEPYSLYRRHSHAISPTGGVSQFGLLQQFSFRMTLVWHLILRSFKYKLFGVNK